ncbi:MAG TPA: sulfur carrier protein ThiS [Jatrophihabitans sp.]|nr:sulfur carrier protein ThiS [Jatrophihabitans sp.]
MRITLNGQAHELGGRLSLADLVRQVSDREAGIAVAVNATVVPRSAWPATVVTEGDQIDVVTAVQGG